MMYSVPTLKGTVTAPLTFYARDVIDRLSNDVIPTVRLTSRSLWDEHLESVGKRKKFTLNRYNYDAMADILLPRAVGYAAGFLDTFFRGSLDATYEGLNLTIWGSRETMIGDFRLLYDTSDGARRDLATWSALRIDPDQSSQALPTPQLPADAAPGAPCWLIFRGQLGTESDAVVGSQVACPSPPPPPPVHNPWVVYSCIYGLYGDPTIIRYRYATAEPPLAMDGQPMPTLYLASSLGSATCSLVVMALPEMPAGTVGQHPF